MRPALALAALLAIAFSGAGARAQNTPDAIGRISYGDAPKPGAAICTGTLIAPDLVLTAGHCARPAINDPAMIRFAAGYANGRATQIRRGAQIILADPLPSGPKISFDLALVVLDSPIAPETVAPLPLGRVTADSFTLIAYRRSAPEQTQRQDDCALVSAQLNLLGLSCQVVSGNSGAPLLQWDGTRWLMAAVIVAADKSAVHAWAVIPPQNLIDRINK